MKRVLIVFGTRPEAVKMAPVIFELRKTLSIQVCVTAQHRQMLDSVLKIFKIKVDYDLDVMTTGQDLFDISTKIMNGIKKVLLESRPNLILVHGDTTTAVTVALSGFYMQIPIAHVEAGLRTNDIFSPFPEEANRQLISRIASFNFTPTENSKLNLINENVDRDKILVTGNTVVDALMSKITEARAERFPFGLVSRLPFLAEKGDRKILLVTGHRRENFGNGLKNVCNALIEIAKIHPSLDIIYPVHLNPKVLGPVTSALSNVHNIYVIDPLEYLSFIKLMDISYLILTDSGGIQEEAPSLNIPVLVTREKTERPEAIETGAIRLVGTETKRIVYNVNLLLSDKNAYRAMSEGLNPFGDGQASLRIRNKIEEVLGC